MNEENLKKKEFLKFQVLVAQKLIFCIIGKSPLVLSQNVLV